MRTGAGNRATRIPIKSAIASDTGISAPISGIPCSTTVRPNSSANSGLPSVDSTIRCSNRRGRLSPSRADRKLRVAARPSGPTWRCCGTRRASACSSIDGGPGRRARRNPTGSEASRRAANEIAVAEAGSSHCTSSTATSTGARAASARSPLRTPSPIACGSGGSPAGSRRNSATSRALRCGPGKPASASSATPSNRSISAVKDSCASRSPGEADKTCRPWLRAASMPASHSVVLPMPGAPINTSGCPAPTRSPSSASSASRPTIELLSTAPLSQTAGAPITCGWSSCVLGWKRSR